MKESYIQNTIINLLKLKGWFTYKNIKTNVNGIPDICAMKEGRVIFLEVKTRTGTVSEVQVETIKRMKAQDIEVYVVRGLDDVKDIINESRQSV